MRPVVIDPKDPQQMLIYNIFKCLYKREVTVMVYRFGLFGFEKLSLAKIGKMFKANSMKIFNIEKKALDKLRTCRGIYSIQHEELLGAIVGFCDCGCPYHKKRKHWHIGYAFVCNDCYENRILN